MDIGIFGDRRTRLPPDWKKETVVTVFGDTDLDASAGSAPHASLTVVALFGDTTVRVPPGARVIAGGFKLFGDRKVATSSGEGPQIRLNVYGLLGDLEVTDQHL